MITDFQLFEKVSNINYAEDIFNRLFIELKKNR